MYVIKIHRSAGFILAEFRGKANCSIIQQLLMEIQQDKRISQNLKLITDYRKAIVDETDIDKLKQLAEYVNTNFANHFNSIKWASLTSSPMHTAASFLFAQMLNSKTIEYNIFTSLSGALERIQLTDHEFQCIENLNK